MDIRNRMHDVVKLRCNACQDFLRMVIVPNWQQSLYNKAKYEVTTSTKLKNKYIPAYEKMRDFGIEEYSIDDMDVTFISELLYSCPEIAPSDKRTKMAMSTLTDNRNAQDHSGENEDDEELYLRGLLDLVNLRNFIRTVDKYETTISDEKRLNFRKDYAKKIDDLKDLLDEERITLIQK